MLKEAQHDFLTPRTIINLNVDDAKNAATIDSPKKQLMFDDLNKNSPRSAKLGEGRDRGFLSKTLT